MPVAPTVPHKIGFCFPILGGSVKFAVVIMQVAPGTCAGSVAIELKTLCILICTHIPFENISKMVVSSEIRQTVQFIADAAQRAFRVRTVGSLHMNGSS